MLGQKTDFQVSAHLDAEGKAAVTVRGSRSYGKKNVRHATVSHHVTDKKTLETIEKALKGVVADVSDDLDDQAVQAAAQCLVVATNKREQL